MKILLFDDTINQWSISRVLMTSLFGIRFERMSRFLRMLVKFYYDNDYAPKHIYDLVVMMIFLNALKESMSYINTTMIKRGCMRRGVQRGG